MSKWIPVLNVIVLFPPAISSAVSSRISKIIILVSGIGLLLAVVGLFRLAFAGTPLTVGLRSTHIIAILLFIGYTAVYSELALDKNIQVNTFLILTVIGLSKLGLAVVQFFLYGGIELVEGVESFAGDGGILGTWSFLATISLTRVFGINGFSKRTLHLLLFVVYVIAITSTFRRNATLKVGVLCIGYVVLLSILRGQFFKGLAWGGAISIGVLTLSIVVLIYQFGYDVALERMLSLSVGGTSQFSSSNSMYLEDWSGWLEAIIKNLPIGSGPGLPYGIVRSSGFADMESEPPLHTGLYEIWVSYGPAGALFQIVIGILIPSYFLRYFKVYGTSNPPLTALAICTLLYSNLWPFGPPYTAISQVCVINAILGGYLISEYTRKEMLIRKTNLRPNTSSGIEAK